MKPNGQRTMTLKKHQGGKVTISIDMKIGRLFSKPLEPKRLRN